MVRSRAKEARRDLIAGTEEQRTSSLLRLSHLNTEPPRDSALPLLRTRASPRTCPRQLVMYSFLLGGKPMPYYLAARFVDWMKTISPFASIRTIIYLEQRGSLM